MEGTLAEIRLFAGNFSPRNWEQCDGQILQIENNQALYALLGTMYGGDGRTTFALPKMKPPPGTPPNSMRYIICINGIFPSRN